jgi:uncharacterized membrane protein YGL010W
MILTPLSPSPLVNNWIERHQDVRSFVLHLLGIPCTILGVLLLPIYVLLLSFTLFLFALALFVGGFLIQFLGHGLDGTEPGEIKGIRIWLAKRRASRLERGQLPVALSELDRS